jgi:hypothetical protein
MTNEIDKLKPWEEKTVEQLTHEEILEWIECTLTRQDHRKPWQRASDILHNVLMWERRKQK